MEKFIDIKNNTFNIGSNKMNYSKAEIANIIKKKIPYYLHYAEIGTDEDKRNYEVDYSKSKKAGFTTKVDIESGLNELIEVCKYLKIYSKYSNI